MEMMRRHFAAVEMGAVVCRGARFFPPRGRFFFLYGCNDRTRVSGLFLRELALGPLMTFGRLDLTVLLNLVRWMVWSVMTVP